MVINKKYFIAFLLFILFAIPLIILGIISYKPVLNVFPQFIELEIQDYYLTFAGIFTFYCLFFWISFKKNIDNLFKYFDQKIYISKFILFSVAFIEFLYICYFYMYSYPILNMTPSFRDVGIIIEDNFAVPILVFIILAMIAFFLILFRFAKKRFSFAFFLAGIILIVMLTFKVSDLNSVDFAYYAGPVNDVLHGKHLLYNSPSQYGFLSIIFLSLIFKFVPLGLMNLTIVNAIIVTSGFILVFILLQFLFKNKPLSLLAIIFIIFLNHTIQIVPEFTILQTSFLRFGMWVVLVLSILIKESYQGIRYKKYLGLIPYTVLIISFFWTLDNGIYIVLAYLAYKAFNNMGPELLLSIKATVVDFLKVGASLVIGYMCVALSYKLLWGIIPNWNYFGSDPALYLKGFGLLPLPNSSWHWIIMAIYLLVLTYLIVIKRFRNGAKLSLRENIVSLVLFYGIFQFSYYMGRSHLNNLHHVIIPFLICVFYMIEIFLFAIKKSGKVSYYFLGSIIVSLFLSLPLYFIFIQGSKNITSYNFFTSLKIIKNRETIEKNFNGGLLGSSTMSLMESKYGDYLSKNGITLISIKDTWYLIALNKANNIESNNLGYYVVDEPLKKIASAILANKYRYIFVDKNMGENFGQVRRIYDVISTDYKEKEQIENLMVLERL